MSKIHTEVKNILRSQLSQLPPSERNIDYPRNYKIKGEDNNYLSASAYIKFGVLMAVIGLIIKLF